MKKAGSYLATAILVLLPIAGWATGTIQGFVYDAKTGQGLPFANVVLEGTKLGSSTDESGFFVITKVPPGEYRITASMISYRPSTQKVKVREGEVARVDFYLHEEAIQLSELVVVGERPMIEREVSASVRAITRKEIEALGVTDVKGLLERQAAVSGEDLDLHIRGGRSNEILMLVDGIPIRDPLSGSAFGMHIPTTAVKELEALTGGFNAEYGEAMSGVINIQLREGSERTHGEITYRHGSFDTQILEMTFSGPLKPLNALRKGQFSVFSNLYWFSTNTYLPHVPKYTLVPNIGPKWLFPREDNTLSGLLKLTWKIDDNRKLSMAFSRSIQVNQGYFMSRREYPFAYGFPYRYIKILENYPTFTRDGNQFIISWHHVINTRNFYDLKFSRFFTNLHLDVQGKHWSEYNEQLDNEPYDPYSGHIGDGFWDTGDAPYWHDHYAEEYSLKFDFTRQISAVQNFKTGFLMQYSEVQWIDIQYPWFYSPGGLGYNHDLYRAYTTKGGAYVQTRIHFAGMVANLGMRIDFWVPGKYVDEGVERALQRYDLPDVVRREYNRYLDNTFKVLGYRTKAHISPRIGVAYPVTERDKFFFSYGHFSQMPDFKYVYSKLGRRATSGYELVGNPNLKPTITVAYELGLEHLFNEYTKLKLTAYYKDIFNYPTALKVPGVPPNPDYWMYFNSDYARATGVEIELRKRLTKRFFADAELTLSQAKGKASTSEDVYWRGGERTLREWHLKWDRPYKLFVSFGWRIKKGDHPQIAGVRLPDNWLLNISMSYQAGRRYTPVDSTGHYGELYSKLGRPWHRVDLRFTKGFQVHENVELEFILEIDNLFNHRNEYYINPLTGRAYEPGDPIPPHTTEAFMLNPARYRSPRRIKVGVGVRM